MSLLLAGAATLIPATAFAKEDTAEPSDQTAPSQQRQTAQAGQTPSPAPAARDYGDDFHAPDITVTAAGVGTLDVLAGTSVMDGTELQENMAGQIGDVLVKLPGVSATGFAPGASRPVLRGFQGERVRVLTDGIGSIDASNTSSDHAVTIDPLTAERIEVLRGPAVLLYGSSAIGGAVNVIDKRIPRKRPDELVHVDTVMAADTASDLIETGGSLDVPLGKSFAFHVDGNYRVSDDISIPGYAASNALRAELLGEAAEEAAEAPEEAAELTEAANFRGKVKNSGTETYTAGAGLTWFGERATLGVSVGLYDTFYGVPTRPGTGHAHEEEGAGEELAEEEHSEETVDIDMRQWRGDLRGSFEFDGGPFESVNTRWGITDYTHVELESGETGTTFNVNGLEGRLELVQRRGLIGGANGGGTIGAQFYRRELEAIGEEAFVAPNTARQYALFTLQQMDFGPIVVEAAGRYERSELEGEGYASRDFDAFSGAIGVWHETPGGVRFGLNASRVARAPAAEELYASGPHVATQQFEVGDPTLSLEKALGLEAYVRGALGPGVFSLTAYASKFDDYIYLVGTGEVEDDLPVYQQMQDDADYIGFEAETNMPLGTLGPVAVSTDLSASYVRAELKDGTPLPLIPPFSARAELVGKTDRLEGKVGVDWNAKQSRIAPYETETGAFTLVDASLAWKPLRGSENVTIIAQAENLLDVTGRRHSSATKDFVPLTGRNFKLSVRLSI